MGVPLILPRKSADELRVLNPTKKIKTYMVPAVMLDVIFKNKQFNLLIELVKGYIVFKPEDNYLVKLINLNDLNMNEAIVLNRALEMDTFDLEQLGGNLGDIMTRNIIDNLCKKEMIIYINGKYTISDEVNFLYNPHEYASFADIKNNKETERIASDENTIKLAEKMDIDAINGMINNICSVKNIKRCWILHHYIEK